MMRHSDLDGSGFARSRGLKKFIALGQITLGGNSKLKIYGTLTCSSGKRMKATNRIFFKNEQEALAKGYRPCGHCMRSAYQNWKQLNFGSKRWS